MARAGRPRAGIRIAGLLAVSLIVPAVGCGLEETSAAPAVDRLGRMIEAEGTVSYQGAKEIECGHRTSFLLVNHHAGGVTELETLGTPSCRRRMRWVEDRCRLFWMSDLELLLRNHRVRATGPTSVHGRRALGLEVRSVYPGRPWMRLVVDEETGLLLETEKYDYEGRRVFSARFTSLLIEPGAQEPPPPGRKGEWPSPRRPDVGEELGFAPLVPRFVPAGFERKWSHVVPRWGGRGLQHETIYSDGLTLLTLSQWRAEEGSEENVVRQKRRGTRHHLRVVVRGVSIRLAGQLSPDELLAVLESLGEADG